MYWVAINNPAVKMASLNGTGQVTLLTESKASYTGITLYKDSLYISDHTRRFAFSTVAATSITCNRIHCGCRWWRFVENVLSICL